VRRIESTMERDTTRKCADVLLVSLLTSLVGACTPEATAPQGGAAINKVVPMAVPDVWCPAASEAGQDSTAAEKKRPGPACHAPKPSASGRGSLTRVAISTWSAPDTAK
jgi:hypothetical protein